MNHPARADSNSTLRRPAADQARRVRQVLDEYLRCRAAGDPPAREALLAAHPDLLPALANELELLHLLDRAVRQAGDRAPSSVGGSSAPPMMRRSFSVPAQIGGYRVERELHRGAQGVVYLAVQNSTGRRVAVKVLHAGAFGAPGDRGRFTREAEILARLRHPNIVSILDSGVADGCCYFAMDYVEGLALDEELRVRPRSVRAAVDLFLQITDAVAAAHARGVVHRDLKPGNIRVDADGRAHVLDFGLAKLLGDPAPLTMTADGQFLGSLPWASPEQIGAAADVDVRSDVYALGVLFFQALTGRFPYPVTGPIQEVIERITQAEPLRPSRLRPEVGNELDTLVLKCLSKSPARRYQSAAELAADLRRFTAGEPLEAKRDSTLYVVGKHMRRHRGAVALAAVLLASLLAFTAYSAAQARASRRLAEREAAARVAAEQAMRSASAAQLEAARERDAAQAAREAEAQQRRAADFEARRATAITAFFVRTFGVADPDASQTGAVTLAALLDRAAGEVESAFAGDPAAEAVVRSVLGRAFAAFGRIEPAVAQLTRAVELHDQNPPTDARERYETLWAYVNALEESATREQWRTQWRRVWRMVPDLLEPAAPDLAELVGRISPEQLDAAPERMAPAFSQIIELAAERLAPDAPEWLLLADYLYAAGVRIASRSASPLAGTLFAEALAIQRPRLATTNVRVVRTIDALVGHRLEAGRFDDAETLVREAIATLQRTLAEDHWFVALNESQLGTCLVAQGRAPEAEPLIRRALQRVEAARGPDSAAAIEVAVRLAELYEAVGRDTDARRCRDSIAERMARTGELEVVFRLPWALAAEHRPLADALAALQAADAAGQRDVAPLVDEALRLRQQLVPDDEPRAALLAEYLWYYGKAFANRWGMSDATLALFTEARQLADTTPFMRPEKHGTIAWWLAYQLERKTDFAAAEPLARQALALFEQQRPVNPRLTALGESLLGGCLSGLQRYAEGEPLLIAGFEGTRQSQGERGRDTDVTLDRLLRHFRESGRPADAAPHVLTTMATRHGRYDTMLQMLEVRSPDLAAGLRDLRNAASDDRPALRQALQSVIDQRRAAFEPDDPDAAFYADAVYAIVLSAPCGGRGFHRDLWLPIIEDMLAIHATQYGPEHLKTTYSQWWQAAALLDCGLIRASAAAAAAGHATRLELLSREFPGGFTRFEHLLAGTAWMAGELPAGEDVLPAVYFRAVDVRGERSIHAIEAFGHVMRMFSERGEPQAADEFALPVLRAAVESSRDPWDLAALALRVLRRPDLSPAVYQAARAAAEKALNIRPDDRDLAAIVCLGDARCGAATDRVSTSGEEGGGEVMDPVPTSGEPRGHERDHKRVHDLPANNVTGDEESPASLRHPLQLFAKVLAARAAGDPAAAVAALREFQSLLDDEAFESSALLRELEAEAATSLGELRE